MLKKILLGPFLNTLSHMSLIWHVEYVMGLKKFWESWKILKFFEEVEVWSFFKIGDEGKTQDKLEKFLEECRLKSTVYEVFVTFYFKNVPQQCRGVFRALSNI